MPNQLVEPVSQVLRVDRSAHAVRLEIAVNVAVKIAVKVALAAGLFVAIVFVPDSVDGTAMPLRAPLFLVDTLGNLFGRYDRRPASAVDRRGSRSAYLPTGLPAYRPTGLLAYRPT